MTASTHSCRADAFKMTTSETNTNPATKTKVNSGRFGEATADAANSRATSCRQRRPFSMVRTSAAPSRIC